MAWHGKSAGSSQVGWSIAQIIQVGYGFLGTIALSSIAPTVAQTSIAQALECQPPATGEYLLIARSRTVEEQIRIRSKVPSDATVIVCNYQGEAVTRIGGFGTEEVAKSWAQYLLQSTNVQSIVVRPNPIAAQPTPAPSPVPTPVASPQPTPVVPAQPTQVSMGNTYDPKPLGKGYAVIVNYNNKPEVAGQLKQALNKDIGVVAYGQRPYLLATHTSDSVAANSIMQLLSDRGFLAMVVDSRQIMLLKSAAVLR
jgi:hypothetical protein